MPTLKSVFGNPLNHMSSLFTAYYIGGGGGTEPNNPANS